MKTILEELKEARHEVREARVGAASLPNSSEAAYALSLEQVSEIAAWKIGGANGWSQAVFKNDKVFWGPLEFSEVMLETDTVDVSRLYAPLAEPELMLELNEFDSSDPRLRFSRMGLGFEIPASVLREDVKSVLAGQMVDRAGAGAVWIGAVQKFDPELATDFVSEFQHNDNEIVFGGSANIIGTPLGAVSDFLQQAQECNLPLQPGQWIASGGLNPAVKISQGDRLRLSALGSCVEVEIHM